MVVEAGEDEEGVDRGAREEEVELKERHAEHEGAAAVRKAGVKSALVRASILQDCRRRKRVTFKILFEIKKFENRYSVLECETALNMHTSRSETR